MMVNSIIIATYHQQNIGSSWEASTLPLNTASRNNVHKKTKTEKTMSLFNDMSGGGLSLENVSDLPVALRM